MKEIASKTGHLKDYESGKKYIKPVISVMKALWESLLILRLGTGENVDLDDDEVSRQLKQQAQEVNLPIFYSIFKYL